MKKTRKTERQSGKRQERQKDNVAKSKEDREINSEFQGKNQTKFKEYRKKVTNKGDRKTV